MLFLSNKMLVDAPGSKLEYYKLLAFELTTEFSKWKFCCNLSNYDIMLPLESSNHKMFKMLLLTGYKLVISCALKCPWASVQ